MKKSLFILSAAALALASCSSDETTDLNNGSAIKFRTALDAGSRVGGVTNVSNLNSFAVTAFGNDGQHNDNYFTNLGVSSNDNGKTWECSTIYYWPTWGLDFYAYNDPITGTAKITSAAQTIQGFKPQAYSEDQVDLVTAVSTGTRAANETAGVPLNFQHALAGIQIMGKIKDHSSIKVEVTGIRLTDVKSGANYSFPVVGKNEPGTWTRPNTTVKYAHLLESGQSQQVTPNVFPLFPGTIFFVTPQQLTAYNEAIQSGARISLRVRAWNVDGTNGKETLIFPTDPTKSNYVYVPISGEWEAGKLYTYVLDFSNGIGKLDPDQTKPVKPGTGEESEEDPEVDSNYPPKDGPKPDDPILKEINFTVTVSDFVNANNINLDMPKL